MFRTARDWTAVVVLALLTGNRGFGQTPATLGMPALVPAPSPILATPQPAPVTQPTGSPAALPSFGPSYEPHNAAPAPLQQRPDCNPYEDNNGPLLKGDPLLDDKCDSPPGWFGATEADLVDTHIKNRLINQIGPDIIHLPTAQLDWTVAPRFEFGYRFGQDAGEIVFSYRFLNSTGAEGLANFDAAGNTAALHSRLDINVWDIDYGIWENSLLPWFEMKWRIGVQIGSNFFDSTATTALEDQRVANDFIGAGPHVGLDLRHTFAGTGLGIFSRIENSYLVGDARQTFAETFFTGPGAAGGGYLRVGAPDVVPWLGVQLGAEWTPPVNDHWCLSVGYTYERWWNYANVGNSASDMWSQGVFFRAEFRY
jgi:Legionella pneumophila major outer membrane protein precursor